MSKLNIAADVNVCPVLELLCSDDINLIPSLDGINIIYKNGEVFPSVDYVLDTSVHGSNEYIMLNTKRTIALNRYSKRNMMNMFLKHGISTPKFTAMYKLVDAPLTTAFVSKAMVDLSSEYILIKADVLARGIGQVKILSKSVPLVIESMAGYLLSGRQDTAAYLKTLGDDVSILGDYHSDEERDMRLHELFQQINRCTIQEWIPDVIEEYRVLMFGNGAMFVYTRLKDSNSSLIDHNSLPPNVVSLIDGNLKNLFLDLSTPFISADIYVRSNGEVGMFEWSNEFAYSYCFNISDISKALTESVVYAANSLND